MKTGTSVIRPDPRRGSRPGHDTYMTPKNGKTRAKPFAPKPGDSVRLFGQEYVAQPHPSAPGIVYSSIAGRATVFQLRDEKGEYFALKAFKRKYQTPELLDSANKLHRVENFEGLRAARRRVVPRSDPAAQTHRNLQYAMLMPWVHGKTWFDVLGQAFKQGYPLDLSIAVRLCDRFLEVMEGLERA